MSGTGKQPRAAGASGSGLVDLRARGISRQQAAELRARLRTSAEEWERPEMDIYDSLGAGAPDEVTEGSTS